MKFKIQIVFALGLTVGYGLCLLVNLDSSISGPKHSKPALTPTNEAADTKKVTVPALARLDNASGHKTGDGSRIALSDDGNAVVFSQIPASLLHRIGGGVFEASGGLRKQSAKEFGLDASKIDKINVSFAKVRQKMYETMCQKASIKNVANGQIIDIPPLADRQNLIDELVQEIGNECGVVAAKSLVDVASASPYYLAFGKFRVNVSIEEEREPEMRKLYPYRLRYEYFTDGDPNPFNAQSLPLNEAEYMRSFGPILRK